MEDTKLSKEEGCFIMLFYAVTCVFIGQYFVAALSIIFLLLFLVHSK